MLKRIRALLGKGIRGASASPTLETPPPPVAPPIGAEPSRSGVVVHVGPRVVHHPIDPSRLDPDAVKICRRLTRFDHSAFLVGGCVRDLLLNRTPKDFDVGTSATPRQVKRLFSNCRIIGRRFRLAHVYFQNGKIIEVATFRARDEAEDGESDLLIRDDNVFGTAEEDALRRDFTVNALFYDVNTGNVLDHADGLGDLRRGLVRTIGDPAVRFREDPIRMLRAIRFAARLGFGIESGTLAALRAAAPEIPRAAAPRILEEINRFCRAGAARRSFELLRETGTFEVVLTELAAFYEERAEAVRLLDALFDAMDRRTLDEREPGTGEIFASLLLPVLAPAIGWTSEGDVRPPHGVDLRTAADEWLRPIAVRLRISRKDQETCRQILQTLARMAPARELRRGQRHAIQRRPAFRDAMHLLDAASRELGGAIRDSADSWHSGLVGAPASVHVAVEEPLEETSAEPGPDRRPRRRRRRGRKRQGDGTTRPALPAASPAPKEHRDARRVASPWDDDYFFAALPSVPPAEVADEGHDRYGADSLASPTAAPLPPGGRTADSSEGRPSTAPRKRRRRRRSRGRGGTPGSDPIGANT